MEVKYEVLRTCFRVKDLNKSVSFYVENLNMVLLRRMQRLNYEIAVLSVKDDLTSKIQLISFENGAINPEAAHFDDARTLLILTTPNIEESRRSHEEKSLISHEIKEFNIYFIKDLDENWIEIVPNVFPSGLSVEDPSF